MTHGNKGKIASAETRRKLSIAHKGQVSSQRIAYGQASLNHLYAGYQKRANRSKRDFDISIAQFKELIIKNCFYCGSSPNGMYYANKLTCYGGIKFNGLDRKNNSEGYTTRNVVPCCKICNYAKHTRNHHDFIEWIKIVHQHLEVK